MTVTINDGGHLINIKDDDIILIRESATELIYQVVETGEIIHCIKYSIH